MIDEGLVNFDYRKYAQKLRDINNPRKLRDFELSSLDFENGYFGAAKDEGDLSYFLGRTFREGVNMLGGTSGDSSKVEEVYNLLVAFGLVKDVFNASHRVDAHFWSTCTSSLVARLDSVKEEREEYFRGWEKSIKDHRDTIKLVKHRFS